MPATAVRGRGRALLAATVLALAGCGAAGGGQAPAGADCVAYTPYGDLTGRQISVSGPRTARPQPPDEASYAVVERCTGAAIRYEASSTLVADLQDRIRAGSPPDLAYLPEPAVLAALVRGTGAVEPAPAVAVANVDRYFPRTYEAAGSVDGTFYAAPLGAEVESLVWYSPRAFASRGYAVPGTWDELAALSGRIAADGSTSWCAASTTGVALTDLLEDAVLRVNGPNLYDEWVRHAVPFDAPQVGAALDRVRAVLGNPRAAPPAAAVGDGGLPILTHGCYLYRQGSSAAADWPVGTEVGPDGDVFAFELPVLDAAGPRTALVDGGFVAAFTDRPEVQAFQAYLASPQWADEQARATPGGGWASASSGLDPAVVFGPVDRLAAAILQDPGRELRFDGSDLMPDAVGSVAFPDAMTAWAMERGATDPLGTVERAWPR